ncbi:MAG: ATP-binding protein [Spirochaetes bacterium GWB1_48_6]|nr:MAG: ATP-binding protein [Spirochaetes bacterium GWB1_48_6]
MADQAEKLRELVKNKSTLDLPYLSDPIPSGKKTRIITITSGKGGVGKTNMAINLALAYSKLGKKVVVMDADLGLANVNVILGVVPKFNLYHMIRQKKTMKEIIADTGYGIQIVAGASGFSQIANLSEKDRHMFISELSSLSFADIIIIDTSAGVSSNVLDFIAAADEALIVTTPEPTAITDAYGLIKIITTEINNPAMGLKLIVNRVKSVTEGKKVADRVINISSQFLNIKVDYLGYVYEDQSVQDSVLQQKPFMIVDPKSKASHCVMNLVSRLERVDYREGSGVGGFISRLFGRM